MGDKHRRKSLSIFKPRADDETLLPSPSSTADPEGVERDHDNENITMLRSKTLQKTSRASVFGSLRSFTSPDDDEKLIRTESKASSIQEDDYNSLRDLFGQTVLHSGEAQIAGSMFRKRTVYFVLTESYLTRFKSQAKAADVLPAIPTPLKRTSTIRGSTTSLASYSDFPQSFQADTTSLVRLDQVVAVYKLDDGRPFFTIEVAHLDEASSKSSITQMQFNDSKEADSWVVAIRTAIKKVQQEQSSKILPHTLDYITGFVDRQLDYDPEHLQAFKVVQRAVHRSTGRTSSEDLSKAHSVVCLLAIGVNKLHLISTGRPSGRSSSTSVTDAENSLSFGIVTTHSINVQVGEEALHIVFKEPLQKPVALQLEASDVFEIVTCLRSAAEYLRPQWIQQPILMTIPKALEDEVTANEWPFEENESFERTLIAYCSAFKVDTSRIFYAVDYDCEDAPRFQLLPNAQRPYTALELLAVFRALRYNESFGTLTFAYVDLNPLRDLYDDPESDFDNLCSRSGAFVPLDGHDELAVLLQEIRALALKSKKLRRLDFTNCFPQLKVDETTVRSCGVPEALAPLCKRSLTNIDWIVLNGTNLAESDIDNLVDVASERRSHIRALELADCGLSVHDADVLLSTLMAQEQTLEVINIAGAQGRFSPELFQQQIGCFTEIRRLDLTRVQKSAGIEPLIAPETLLNWRLEELYLGQTTINERGVDSLAEYLANPMSNHLRELHLNQCGITAKDVALLFQSMAPAGAQSRPMHVNVSENRLKIGFTLLFKVIAENQAPTHLTMRMMDFEKEQHFRELVHALQTNSTLRKFDISKSSLPYDAGEETCKALEQMFMENQALEELDISGEHAHLDAAKFGIGLKQALRGLKTNKSLKVLRIEHQGLGAEGLHTLAELLKENKTLLEVHCDNNDVDLQSLTTLVDALQENKSLWFLSDLDFDREKALQRARRASMATGPENRSRSPAKRGSGIRKSLAGGFAHRTQRLSLRVKKTPVASEQNLGQDTSTAVADLGRKWDTQSLRMREYLDRNYRLANGLPWDEDGNADGKGAEGEPGTASSLGAAPEGGQAGGDSPVEQGAVESIEEKLAEERAPVELILPEEK